MNNSIIYSSDSHIIQYEGYEISNINISRLLPYSSNMVYKDRFGVYYVNKRSIKGKRNILPVIREIQVPKYDINLNQENQIVSNNTLYQCRQLMKKNRKSDAITLSSRFLYSIPPIHFNHSKSWNSYISKARNSIKNKPNRKNKKLSIDGPFVHTSIGTFVENVRYNTQKSVIELLIPHAHPSTRNND